MYVNKIEKRIPFQIKTGYYFVKLLGSTKIKITKNESF